MRLKFRYIISVLAALLSLHSYGQTDKDRPLSPVLDLVTVNQVTGNPELTWTLSPSPDVSGYVVYSYLNGEWFALDTLKNPFITTWTRTGSGSSYFSESFVVAALDSSGNISPLSNALHTIFAEAEIDTCNKKIIITWNSYASYPRNVLSYSILFTTDGSGFTEAGQVTPDKTNLIVDDFVLNTGYCFIVRANLSEGFISRSNKPCVLTKMLIPPGWINADYSRVTTDKDILVSFTIDPLSEVNLFMLERKAGVTGLFQEIARLNDVTGTITYTDRKPDLNKVYYYRLSALNNCSSPIVFSNVTTNIVLSLKNVDNSVVLSWNPYKDWNGEIETYRLFVNKGDVFEERVQIVPSDTSYTLASKGLLDIMYEASGSEVCFMIKASEISNPFGVSGESYSSVVCTPVTEVITVPNAFTPDNNSVNDHFKPVLSFTPKDYKLIITDLRHRTVFETNDFNSEWDGTSRGNQLPAGLYLWYLNLMTPSGRKITRTGTVTIIFNR